MRALVKSALVSAWMVVTALCGVSASTERIFANQKKLGVIPQDAVAQVVPTLVEQMHVADFLLYIR